MKNKVHFLYFPVFIGHNERFSFGFLTIFKVLIIIFISKFSQKFRLDFDMKILSINILSKSAKTKSLALCPV